MQISENGIALIKKFEDFVAHIYKDAAGYPTIGYGHRILPGEDWSAGITEQRASELLLSDVTPIENELKALIPSDCTQNQFDALCSFGYNLGEGSLKTMLAHGWDQVAVQMPFWNHVNHVVNSGLTARRQAEVDLFNEEQV